MNPVDVLIVGGGPAGLAAAIRIKQKNKEASVVLIEKAARLGYHSLSGAAFETACLDELLPGWRESGEAFVSEMVPVERDEMFFLTSRAAFQIPPLLVPSGMHHKGDRLISLGRLVSWLGRVAAREGVEVYTGFSAASLVWDKDEVKGVTLVDAGLDANRQPKKNFLKGETILAKTVVLADGAGGVLSREYTARIGGNKNPQVFSIGVKQILRLPAGNAFGAGRVVHTLGFPSRPDVFGGGFFYSMGKDLVAAGLILGLDWKYTDLDPQKEFEILKAHPFVAGLFQGAQVVSAGAKMIPEGGFFSLPRLWGKGIILVGDSAGFVNMEKIKGVHYAVLSGMAAADAIASGDLSSYTAGLEARGVLKDLRHARNFRQVFQAGLFAGAPLSQIQSILPFRVGIHQDHTRTKKGACLRRRGEPALDRATFAALSNTMHREDEPSHLAIPDPGLCALCAKDFGSPCTTFCPVEVYRRQEEAIHISPSNCVHCGTCVVKCPFQNIRWSPPEGGEGPRYKMM